MTIQESIKQWMRQNETNGIRLLQKLVGEASTRGNEYKAQAVIMEKCRELGLTMDIFDVDETNVHEHELFSCDRKDFKNQPNVIATWNGTGGGRSIILNSHIDVVPAGDGANWTHPPFQPKVIDGRCYGRGTTDMKGGTVSLLLAMEALKSLNISLKGDVVFQSVIEEESGGTGTLSAVVRGYKADGALIPEPTNMKLFPKQQGSMWFRIAIKGKSAHGGTRYEGVNAIMKATQVMQALQQLEAKRNKRIVDPLYEEVPIPVPINIGKIQGGEWPSSVPDLVTLEGRIGVAPNETNETVQEEFETEIAEFSRRDEWLKDHLPTVEWFGGCWQAGDLPEGHLLMAMLEDCYQDVLDETPIAQASPWGTDGGVLWKAGKIPVVIFGPGTTEVAHDSDEYIELQQMFRCAEVYASMLLNWCEVSDLTD
ncbi:peptidase [Bacillus sp. 2205SS5-2]|uniref:peptidase n=1 Tax=Bacillus sp. 2205SS5-2 TaxID=3109031 RepID=UPI003005E3DE